MVEKYKKLDKYFSANFVVKKCVHHFVPLSLLFIILKSWTGKKLVKTKLVLWGRKLKTKYMEHFTGRR